MFVQSLQKQLMLFVIHYYKIILKTMDWKVELILIIRTLLAVILGALIGLEREFHGKEAGIRTYAAVALGACTFGLISNHINDGLDTRIAANVAVGIGFLGAGMIIKEADKITGLTTAATIWATAAMGLSIASGMYVLGILTALIIFCILAVDHLSFWKKIKRKSSDSND